MGTALPTADSPAAPASHPEKWPVNRTLERIFSGRRAIGRLPTLPGQEPRSPHLGRHGVGNEPNHQLAGLGENDLRSARSFLHQPGEMDRGGLDVYLLPSARPVQVWFAFNGEVYGRIPEQAPWHLDFVINFSLF